MRNNIPDCNAAAPRPDFLPQTEICPQDRVHDWANYERAFKLAVHFANKSDEELSEALKKIDPDIVDHLIDNLEAFFKGMRSALPLAEDVLDRVLEAR